MDGLSCEAGVAGAIGHKDAYGQKTRSNPELEMNKKSD